MTFHVVRHGEHLVFSNFLVETFIMFLRLFPDMIMCRYLYCRQVKQVASYLSLDVKANICRCYHAAPPKILIAETTGFQKSDTVDIDTDIYLYTFHVWDIKISQIYQTISELSV